VKKTAILLTLLVLASVLAWMPANSKVLAATTVRTSTTIKATDTEAITYEEALLEGISFTLDPSVTKPNRYNDTQLLTWIWEKPMPPNATTTFSDVSLTNVNFTYGGTTYLGTNVTINFNNITSAKVTIYDVTETLEANGNYTYTTGAQIDEITCANTTKFFEEGLWTFFVNTTELNFVDGEAYNFTLTMDANVTYVAMNSTDSAIVNQTNVIVTIVTSIVAWFSEDAVAESVSVSLPDAYVCGVDYWIQGIDYLTVEWEVSPSVANISKGYVSLYNATNYTVGEVYFEPAVGSVRGVVLLPVADLPDGEYTVNVTIIDMAYERDRSAPATEKLPSAPIIETVDFFIGNDLSAVESIEVEVSPTTDGFVESLVSIHIWVNPKNTEFNATYTLLNAAGDVVEEENITIVGGFYGIVWDTTQYSDGTYTVSVTGVDSFGNKYSAETSVIVDNTAPEIVISSPTNGSVLTGTVTINVTVTDPYIESVTLRIDAVEISLTVTSGTPTLYTWDTTLFGDGSHLIIVTASDHLREASAAIKVETRNYIKTASSALNYGLLLGLPLGLGIGVIISFALAKAMLPKKPEE